MRIRSVGLIAVVATVGALVTGGCGGDGDGDGRAHDSGRGENGEDAAGEAPETTARVAPDVAAYCDAQLAFETSREPRIDYNTATAEEQAESLRTYGRETLRPLADDLVAAAPEDLAADVARLSAAVDEVVASGDRTPLDEPEVEAARDALHEFDLENCGWRVQEVTAAESTFTGIPTELDAGPTSFELVNEGQQLHELVLVRRNEGVNLSVDELLAMPEEQSLELVTEVGAAFTAQGERDHVVVDLEPGGYIGACFVLAGTTDLDTPPPTPALPHAAQGMLLEFTVT